MRRPGGGAVTIWSNGETVLGQLGVDMDGAGQLLSNLRVMTSTGRPVTTLDLGAIVGRMGAPVRMVPRRVLLDRLLEHFKPDRIRFNYQGGRGRSLSKRVRLEFDDGSSAEGDLLIGADGLHSMVRDIVGAQPAEPTGWCSWQGLVTLPHIADKRCRTDDYRRARKPWPVAGGGSDVQWWFDLPWSPDFVRPDRPIDVIRSNFTGWSDSVDRVLATLTDDDLARSPFPHFRHPIPRPGRRGDVARRCGTHDAAHPRAGNQPGAARHDGVVQGAFGFPEAERHARATVISRARCAGTRTPGDAGSRPCPG